LFAFIIASTQAGTTLTTHSINFIYKDNARKVFFCLLEHLKIQQNIKNWAEKYRVVR
jgi:hypothetical protein